MDLETCSIILAAGRGSRMKGYLGNKTLLPLIPISPSDPYRGSRPFLIEILQNLPPGPKGVVVHHKREEVEEALAGMDVTFIYQPILDGTGGALLCARKFLEDEHCNEVLITVGDAPLVRKTTFLSLKDGLKSYDMMVLGFRPEHKRKYGLVVCENDQVTGIVEWKYWSQWQEHEVQRHSVCNSGIYAFKKEKLSLLLDCLKDRPHTVKKVYDGKEVTITEYFLTDVVAIAKEKGMRIGLTLAGVEEATGVDDHDSLVAVQQYYKNYCAGLELTT